MTSTTSRRARVSWSNRSSTEEGYGPRSLSTYASSPDVVASGSVLLVTGSAGSSSDSGSASSSSWSPGSISAGSRSDGSFGPSAGCSYVCHEADDNTSPTVRGTSAEATARSTSSRTTPSGSANQAGSQTRATAGQPMMVDKTLTGAPSRSPVVVRAAQ